MNDSCDHYIHESERSVGFTTCFKCDVAKALTEAEAVEREARQAMRETCTGPNNEYACLWDGARYLNCTSKECTDPLCVFIGACPCEGCDYSMCHVRIKQRDGGDQ